MLCWIRFRVDCFEFGSLLVYKDESIGPSLTRAFTSVIANPKLDPHYCLKASKAVGLGTKNCLKTLW